MISDMDGSKAVGFSPQVIESFGSDVVASSSGADFGDNL